MRRTAGAVFVDFEELPEDACDLIENLNEAALVMAKVPTVF